MWRRTSVIVGLSPLEPGAAVAIRAQTDDPAPRGFVCMDWHFASWTAMDLDGAYLTFVESEDELDAAQDDPACLFRWHADIFDAVTQDVFRVNHLPSTGTVSRFGNSGRVSAPHMSWTRTRSRARGATGGCGSSPIG